MTSSASQMPKTITLGGVLAVFLFCNAALGQESPAPGIEFELGAGLSVAPSFEGSKDYEVSGFPVIRFGYLVLQNGFSLGGGDGQGLSVSPSFRYVGARETADNSALAGLTDVDAAIELGGGIKYTFGSASVFSDIRYGFSGHHGFVGEMGADYVLSPTDHITIAIGPRVSWASGDYMDQYFSVSASEAAASGFASYDAGAGIKSVGLEAAIRRKLSENWALETGAGYDRLVGVAANSPIIDAGSKDQFSARIALVRMFRIDF